MCRWTPIIRSRALPCPAMPHSGCARARILLVRAALRAALGRDPEVAHQHIDDFGAEACRRARRSRGHRRSPTSCCAAFAGERLAYSHCCRRGPSASPRGREHARGAGQSPVLDAGGTYGLTPDDCGAAEDAVQFRRFGLEFLSAFAERRRAGHGAAGSAQGSGRIARPDRAAQGDDRAPSCRPCCAPSPRRFRRSPARLCAT